jgi:hypothetical protein
VKFINGSFKYLMFIEHIVCAGYYTSQRGQLDNLPFSAYYLRSVCVCVCVCVCNNFLIYVSILPQILETAEVSWKLSNIPDHGPEVKL